MYELSKGPYIGDPAHLFKGLFTLQLFRDLYLAGQYTLEECMCFRRWLKTRRLTSYVVWRVYSCTDLSYMYIYLIECSFPCVYT